MCVCVCVCVYLHIYRLPRWLSGKESEAKDTDIYIKEGNPVICNNMDRPFLSECILCSAKRNKPLDS